MKPVEIEPNVFLDKLNEDLDLMHFDCGHEDTNEFLKEDALAYQNKDVAITYVLRDRPGNVFGFVSLAMGAIKVKDFKKLTVPDVEIEVYPGVKIGRLGVDKYVKNKGFGTTLIDLSMKLALKLKGEIGCRFLLVDSYTEAIDFYKNRGFRPLYSKIKDRKTMPMYMRTKIEK